MKTFSKWKIGEVEEEFQVREIIKSKLLHEWMCHQTTPSEFEQIQLQHLATLLQEGVYHWNEHELSMKFIGPLLTMVNFDQPNYHSFMQRELSAPYKNETLSGLVDMVVAQGRRDPKKPYFFIHEYKKDQDPSGDPLAQLLVTMIAAQLLNQDDQPIYGGYVMGRMWYFAVLDGKEYSVHPGLNAIMADDITEIFGVLKNAKAIIDRMVAPDDYTR